MPQQGQPSTALFSPVHGRANKREKRFIMNKIALLIVAILACSIFAADTLYLKDGKEIKDATIVEVGASEVKYKVGAKEVLYIARKSDIAAILYSNGTREVFEESKSENMQNSATPNAEAYKYENFSAGRRFGTWALNAFTINGLGSWMLMGDVVGGFVHLGFGVASVVALWSSLESISYTSCYNDGSCQYHENRETWGDTWLPIIWVSGAIWNIYRSAAYDKPHPKTAHSGNSGFNLAVLPNRHGHLMPAVTYNKTF